VLDGAPTDAAIRKQVAFVSLEPVLPMAMRVAEVFEIAASIRGDPQRDPVERLGALGVEALAARKVGTLSREETRAVALAEAVTSSCVHVLLIEEPLLSVDPRAAGRLPEVLRARSRADSVVVVATASVRDAQEVADDYVLLRAGAMVGKALSLDKFAGLSDRGARLRMVTTDPRALAAALARDERVEAVARSETSVTVRGPDPLELARAVARAVVASGVSLTELRIEPPSREEATMALARTPEHRAAEEHSQ
jgi:ABC-2 type transport system ATP-binding protein